MKMLVTVLSPDGGDTPRVCGAAARTPEMETQRWPQLSNQCTAPRISNWPDQRMGLWFAGLLTSEQSADANSFHICITVNNLTNQQPKLSNTWAAFIFIVSIYCRAERCNVTKQKFLQSSPLRAPSHFLASFDNNGLLSLAGKSHGPKCPPQWRTHDKTGL